MGQFFKKDRHKIVTFYPILHFTFLRKDIPSARDSNLGPQVQLSSDRSNVLWRLYFF